MAIVMFSELQVVQVGIVGRTLKKIKKQCCMDIHILHYFSLEFMRSDVSFLVY